jgi:hypothetical protein
MDDLQLQRTAKKRVEMKLGFLTHLVVFLCVNAGFALFGGARFEHVPMWGWGLGLAIHGVATLFALHGSALRERLMAAELEALRQR